MSEHEINSQNEDQPLLINHENDDISGDSGLLGSDVILYNESKDPSVVVVKKSCCGRGAKVMFTVVILCSVNLLNYIDRYTIAGQFVTKIPYNI